jgi:outer membrane protein insertion porin family
MTLPLPAKLGISIKHLISICIMFSFLLTLAGGVFAAQTRFLPLNVKSPENIESLEKLADEQLQSALSNSDIVFVPRATADRLANYQGSWPPAAGELRKIAEVTDSDNLAVGNLTVIGDNFSVDVKLFDLLSPESPTFYFATATSLDELKDALNSISSEILAYTEKEFRIASIAPEGNTRIDSGAILRKINTRVGDTYNPAALREDLKAIYSMGYFNDVQIDVSETDQGKKIIFRVVEKPIIKAVIFNGISELKEEDVKQAANIKEFFILNPAKITLAEQAIRQLYKTKGFYNSQVSSTISYPDDTGAIVEINIIEGSEVYIREITVEGNLAYDDDELLDQIESGERNFLSWFTETGLLDMNKITQDSQRIVAFYANNGYLDARVAEPVITQQEDGLYIKFVVEEGVRYRVGNVDVTGDLLGGRDRLLPLLQIRNSKFISREVIRDDILRLTDYYSEAGYAFASIRPEIQKAPVGNRMDITYEIREGSLVYINRIAIKGNTRTRDNVIRRELRIAEGGIFDSTAIRQSTQALQRLGFFEEVNITPEPALDPDRMNIIVEVKEKSTGNFSVGVGYSSVDNLIVSGQISENNFLGRGDTLSLSGNIGGSSSLYNLAYTNPHLNDSALSWGLDLFRTDRDYDDYTKESTGGGIRIGYPIFELWRVFANYSYTDTQLSNVSPNASFIIRESVDLNITSAIRVSMVRDTRNMQFDPSSGSRNVLSVEYAGGPLSGDAQFTKVEGSTSWYFPMPLKTVFHVKGAAGQVFENETGKLPVYERFYLGGLNTVRGFKYATISPIDPLTGDRIGGDKMWYTNTEIIFPLLQSQGLNGLVFFDAGQVLDDKQEFFEFNENIKKSVGLGANWLSPMGPLRIVWGYNLDPLPDEDQSVFDFSIGGSF